MGGFNNYGEVKNDFVMMKGCVMGKKKRVIKMRKYIIVKNKRKEIEKINMKLIEKY